MGQEPLIRHQVRCRLALAPLRLTPWPYKGRIVVVERDWRGEEDLIVLADWCHLGTVREEAAARELQADSARFDADVYHILKRFLSNASTRRIVEID